MLNESSQTSMSADSRSKSFSHDHSKNHILTSSMDEWTGKTDITASNKNKTDVGFHIKTCMVSKSILLI